MKVKFIPWQHECDRSAGGRQNVTLVGRSAEDVAKQFSSLPPFSPFENPTSSKMIHGRLQWRPTQVGVVSDLDQPGYFKTRKL
jgi:hypothetical protein